MAILKCKMCGGDLNLVEGNSIAECEFCGTVQTVPTVDNEKKLTLFARANRLRAACEFDKASGIYESIVGEFPEEAEAYWGLILCKYGIEYVDDPATGKKIPTCHRSSFDCVLDDANFELVMEYADAVARKVYREEAKAIEELRKGIVEVSSKEEPYDIFICYKETAEDGQRTLDSVLAQDIYDALTEKGYRVFFSRIALEDKLGQEYEPYIFAALHSAKIMLAVGTDYEYYNAVWVKNEWSRFLQLMTKDKSKYLIPCFKGIDAYDMPKEFTKLQAQDLSKVGAMQDLLRGIDKLIGKQDKAVQAGDSTGASEQADALIDRGYLYLEDGDYKKADEYFERALDATPRAWRAYLGKVLSSHRSSNLEQIQQYVVPLDADRNFMRAIQFSPEKEKRQLEAVLERAKKKVQIYLLKIALTKLQNRKTIYEKAASAMQEGRFIDASALFCKIPTFADAMAQSHRCMALEKERTEEAERRKSIAEEERRQRNRSKIPHLEKKRNELKIVKNAIAAGDKFSIGVMPNGRVVTTPSIINVNKWESFPPITAVCASKRTCMGLCNDGKVLTNFTYSSGGSKRVYFYGIGDGFEGFAVSINDNVFLGLKKDNTVYVRKAPETYGSWTFPDVKDWSDIVAISSNEDHILGLKRDGTVVATSPYGLAKDGQCDVLDWTDIVAISAGKFHSLGLKADGTVVATGRNGKKACEVSDWEDIVAISAGYDYSLGLKVDGTVVAAGLGTYGECEVCDWKDIVAISANYHSLGLRADGSVVAAGGNTFGRCNVQDWRLISLTEAQRLEKERKEEEKRLALKKQKEEEERKAAENLARLRDLRKTAGLCQYCGGTLKGLFLKKCTKCGKAKDY